MTLSILSSVIDIYSKCAWIVPLKNKKGIPIPPTYSPQYNSDKSGLERNILTLTKNTCCWWTC